jgi:hypothetical protein
VPPVDPETGDSIRYELPVTVGGVKGLVVIRWFVGWDEGDASIRGKATCWNGDDETA